MGNIEQRKSGPYQDFLRDDSNYDWASCNKQSTSIFTTKLFNIPISNILFLSFLVLGDNVSVWLSVFFYDRNEL